MRLISSSSSDPPPRRRRSGLGKLASLEHLDLLDNCAEGGEGKEGSLLPLRYSAGLLELFSLPELSKVLLVDPAYSPPMNTLLSLRRKLLEDYGGAKAVPAKATDLSTIWLQPLPEPRLPAVGEAPRKARGGVVAKMEEYKPPPPSVEPGAIPPPHPPPRPRTLADGTPPGH